MLLKNKMIYLVEQINGEPMAVPVDRDNAIRLRDLNSRVKVISGARFRIENRDFLYSTYAEENKLIHVIECDFLKWQTYLEYKDDKFLVATPDAKNNDQVYLKDVTLYCFPAPYGSGQTGLIYIGFKNSDQSPLVTNIWETGKVCTGSKFNVLDTPQKIVSVIENSPGNRDLAHARSVEIKKHGIFHTMTSDRKAALDHKCKGLTI